MKTISMKGGTCQYMTVTKGIIVLHTSEDHFFTYKKTPE
jgi:hypothetical protein